MARLNNEVATGRRMKGAEICILVCSARSSSHELRATGHPGRIPFPAILIQVAESYLNMVAGWFPGCHLRGSAGLSQRPPVFWSGRRMAAQDKTNPWLNYGSFQAQCLGGHVRVLESATSVKQNDAVLSREESAGDQVIVGCGSGCPFR